MRPPTYLSWCIWTILPVLVLSNPAGSHGKLNHSYRTIFWRQRANTNEQARFSPSSVSTTSPSMYEPNIAKRAASSTSTRPAVVSAIVSLAESVASVASVIGKKTTTSKPSSTRSNTSTTASHTSSTSHTTQATTVAGGIISVLTATDGKTASITWAPTVVTITPKGGQPPVKTRVWSCEGPICDKDCLVPAVKCKPSHTVGTSGFPLSGVRVNPPQYVSEWILNDARSYRHQQLHRLSLRSEQIQLMVRSRIPSPLQILRRLLSLQPNRRLRKARQLQRHQQPPLLQIPLFHVVQIVAKYVKGLLQHLKLPGNDCHILL